MKSSNNLLKDYLSFSKKEAIAFTILSLVIILLITLPFYYSPSGNQGTQRPDTSWMIAANKLQVKESSQKLNREAENNPSSYQYDNTDDEYKSARNGRLFNFDPNTLSESGWKELGLRDRTVRTILNYRGKGGRFRKPEDLQKIYGLHADEFARLKPFIVIAASNILAHQYNENYSKNNAPATSSDRPAHRQNIININVGDTSAFKSLYGIGSKLAARIVNFRTKLGGFYSIEQVGETYGVPDSTFQKIKPFLHTDGETIQKININTATYEQLNAHPYISNKLAFLIVKQRKEKGDFSKIEDIVELVAQTNDSFEKIKYYISVI